MAKLYNEYKESGFVVLAIDIQEKRKTVKAYMKKEKLPFPVLLDTDGQVARIYGVRAHPAHFLIDRAGNLIGTAPGARDWTEAASRNLIRLLVERLKLE